MRFSLDHPTLRLAIVSAGPVRCELSPPELVERMNAAALLVRRDPSASSAAVRAAIRDVLRVGGFKPAGRGKPASEFLHAVACEQGLPIVNNLVDINNLVSLRTALPISMFDAEKLGTPVVIRFGRPGESYVFNVSGQRMDVNGIPVVFRAMSDEPVGNAVKDSMLAKVGPETRNVLAVVYGSRKLDDGLLEGTARDLQALLAEFASAQDCAWSIRPDSLTEVMLMAGGAGGTVHARRTTMCTDFSHKGVRNIVSAEIMEELATGERRIADRCTGLGKKLNSYSDWQPSGPQAGPSVKTAAGVSRSVHA